MQLKFLQAKLHRVRVTGADLDYEGSCGIDGDLLEASGMREFQHIDIYSVTTGNRFSTYIIKAPRGSGTISLNGAAARMVQLGDLLIIATYNMYTEEELRLHKPKIVLVDDHNRPIKVSAAGAAPAVGHP
jgi:aspartate 1-decarboxylase